MKRYFALFLAISVFISCQELVPQKNAKGAEYLTSQEDYYEKMKQILPCESISYGFSTKSSVGSMDKKALDFTLNSPQIDFKEEKILRAYVNDLEKLTRKEITNLNSYNGFNLTLNKRSVESDTLIKEEKLTFRFNSVE